MCIESKFFLLLWPKTAKFADSDEGAIESLAESAWAGVYGGLKFDLRRSKEERRSCVAPPFWLAAGLWCIHHVECVQRVMEELRLRPIITLLPGIRVAVV